LLFFYSRANEWAREDPGIRALPVLRTMRNNKGPKIFQSTTFPALLSRDALRQPEFNRSGLIGFTGIRVFFASTSPFRAVALQLDFLLRSRWLSRKGSRAVGGSPAISSPRQTFVLGLARAEFNAFAFAPSHCVHITDKRSLFLDRRPSFRRPRRRMRFPDNPIIIYSQPAQPSRQTF